MTTEEAETLAQEIYWKVEQGQIKTAAKLILDTRQEAANAAYDRCLDSFERPQ